MAWYKDKKPTLEYINDQDLGVLICIMHMKLLLVLCIYAWYIKLMCTYISVILNKWITSAVYLYFV
jgi:hypothetical protein